MFEEDLHNFSVDSVRQKLKNFSPSQPVVSRPVISSRPKIKSDPWQRPAKRGSWHWLFSKKLWIAVLVLVLASGLIFAGYKVTSWGQKIFSEKNPLAFLAHFGQLLTSGDKKVTGEAEGEVNILLLGIGGEGHQGALLTDTMILATIKPDGGADGNGAVTLLSIPRDLVTKLPGSQDWRKINSAYAYGEMKERGLGAQWAMQAVADWTGKTIPYYALVDFSGFKQAIDDVGGIDVNVETAFSDSSYPDYKNGYLPTIRFEKGQQHMDGERALQFTRSRHGTNGEGSDFARSRRQQLVLLAIRDKVLKLHFVSNLGTITRLLDNFSDHFKTNLQPFEMLRVYNLVKDTKAEDILPVSLDPSTGLICPEIDPVTSAYILSPCRGKTKADIQKFAANLFTVGRLIKEGARVEFQNSTKVAALAQRAKAELLPYDQNAITANFPGKEQYEKTIIFDLSGGQKTFTLDYLKSKLQAVVDVNYPYPDKLAAPKPDFVVVLGQNDKDTFPELKPLPPLILEPAASNGTVTKP